MKIGFIGSLDFGNHSGARTRATRIYSLLAENHEVTFFNVNTLCGSPIPEEISGRDVVLRPKWLPHTGRELIAGFRAMMIAKQYDFDLIWSYNSFQHTPIIAYLTAEYIDVPLIVGVNDHRHGRGIKGRLVNEFGRSYVLNRAEILVFESDTLQRNLDEYGIHPNQSIAVPTGIDIDEYYLPNEPTAKEPTIFYVGRDKDIDLLLDAAAAVHDKIPNVTVRLAGVDPNAYPEYMDKPYIKFLGFVDEEDLRREMARAHVCTVPYRDAHTAGRPVKILEYMSAAKCIVATDLPFNTQMLTDGENAIITDVDPNSFAEGLLYALNHPENREYCAKQARNDVQVYSLEQMREKLNEVLQLAIAN